ncbi:MAG TPA: putative sulfate exporter family transporter [Candidatus Baltobacteraceae bacterium]|nr:putative sulfate exporter family transporter [Candidatus Baltobacteraceae bacterium]
MNRRGAIAGVVTSALIAAVAWLCARAVPLVGAPVFAIVLGALLRSVRPLPAGWRPGTAFAARTVLQAAIVLSGFGLSLATVIGTGLGTLPVTLSTIAVALVLAPLAGRALRLDASLQTLVGCGTAICGASAIAAVSAVVEPPEADVALSIATVFFYNIVAVFVFPPIGHALHMTQDQFGLWAGTAINDTSSVVAAGYVYGHEAGAHATIVKLTRATLILPMVAGIALLRARAHRGEGKAIPWRHIVPWFILWFLVAALASSAGLFPGAWRPPVAEAATYLISVALAAIGLQTDLPRLVRTGARPLALGASLWIAVAVTSLAVQRATGT